MPDIAEQLDRAIGAAPSDAPGLETTLALGRRALLRRRMAYGVGAATTALVIGGTAWAISPGDSSPNRSGEPGFVGEPSDSPSAEPERPADADRRDRAADGGVQWAGQDAARLDRSGRLEVRPGWHLVEDLSRPGMVAVAVAKGDRRQWFLFGDAMTISSLNAPERGYDSFREWVDVNGPYLDDKHTGGGDDVTDWPGVPRDDLVVFVPRRQSSARGLVAAREGVVVVDQRYDVDLGESFAAPQDTGVAEVRAAGETWYVVARRPDDYIAVQAIEAEADYGVNTLDEFIDFARERYAEGGGGLL